MAHRIDYRCNNASALRLGYSNSFVTAKILSAIAPASGFMVPLAMAALAAATFFMSISAALLGPLLPMERALLVMTSETPLSDAVDVATAKAVGADLGVLVAGGFEPGSSGGL